MCGRATGVKHGCHLTEDDWVLNLVLSFLRLDINCAQFCVLVVFTFLQRALKIRSSDCLQKAEWSAVSFFYEQQGLRWNVRRKKSAEDDRIEDPDESWWEKDAGVTCQNIMK